MQEIARNDYPPQSIIVVSSYCNSESNRLNNYSVTAAGVGAALKRSASALQVAGNTFQESAAMVTGISEVTQDPKLHWGLA